MNASRLTLTLLTLGAIVGGAFIMLSDTKPSDRAPVAATAETMRKVVVARGVIDIEGGIIQVAASRDGVIREIRVEEGAEVKQGDILAVLDDRVPRAALTVAKAELAQAEASLAATRVRLAAGRREVARLESLKLVGATPTRNYDQATDTMRIAEADFHVQNAAIETARSRVAQAELELEQRTIRAPVDGVIVRRLARPGDGASTLNVTTLFWLAPTVPRIARVEVEELSGEQIRPGQRVEIAIDGDETRRFAATVERVGQAFGPRRITVYDARERADVRFVEAVITFPAPDTPLFLGQRIIAHIEVQ